MTGERAIISLIVQEFVTDLYYKITIVIVSNRKLRFKWLSTGG